MELMCSKSMNKLTYRWGRFSRYSLMIFSSIGLICASSILTANTLSRDMGAYHQSGIVEAKNKTLVYGSRTFLLHAKRR